MTVGYAQTRRDYIYLNDIQEVDVTGDFADFNAVHFLLNPCKKEFAEHLQSGIDVWFNENIDMKFDRRTKAIARRHDMEHFLEGNTF